MTGIAAAEALALEQDDGIATSMQHGRGGEAGHPAADHGDVGAGLAAQRRVALRRG